MISSGDESNDMAQMNHHPTFSRDELFTNGALGNPTAADFHVDSKRRLQTATTMDDTGLAATEDSAVTPAGEVKSDEDALKDNCHAHTKGPFSVTASVKEFPVPFELSGTAICPPTHAKFMEAYWTSQSTFVKIIEPSNPARGTASGFGTYEVCLTTICTT